MEVLHGLARADGWGTGTEVTNSRLRAGRLHAPDDDIEFIFLRVTNFFFQSVWMQPGTNVSTPKGTRAVRRGDIIQGQHAHTKPHINVGVHSRLATSSWLYNTGPTRVAHSRYSTTISEDASGTC